MTPRSSASTLVRSAARDITARSRLVLALKTAIAAALAWYLAPWVPFADAEYSYYAPLGVLVSMHPTLADSARSGAQAVVGLAAGIALGLGGLAVVWAGAPGIVGVATVVGVGVALGGIRSLGTGRDWIAIAALFVLLLGGREVDEFSLSYLVTMAFGVVVGVAANLVFPPVYLQHAAQRLSDLRGELSATLERMADMLDAGAVDADELTRRGDELAALAAAVSVDVDEADRSRRANLRARRMGEVHRSNTDRWWALERATFFCRDLADLLSRHPEIAAGAPGEPALLADAMRRTAAVVATPPGDAHAPARLDDAAEALERYAASLDLAVAGRVTDRHPALAAASSLGRLTEISRPFA